MTSMNHQQCLTWSVPVSHDSTVGTRDQRTQVAKTDSPTPPAKKVANSKTYNGLVQ